MSGNQGDIPADPPSKGAAVRAGHEAQVVPLDCGCEAIADWIIGERLVTCSCGIKHVVKGETKVHYTSRRAQL